MTCNKRRRRALYLCSGVIRRLKNMVDFNGTPIRSGRKHICITAESRIIRSGHYRSWLFQFAPVSQEQRALGHPIQNGVGSHKSTRADGCRNQSSVRLAFAWSGSRLVNNFLTRIMRPDDRPRQAIIARVTSGRMQIEGAVNKLEQVIGEILEENNRLTQRRSKYEEPQ